MSNILLKMDKKFTLEIKKLKNIILFNPEIGPEDLSNTESSIFIKIDNKKLLFEILSFRYLLVGKEDIDSTENMEMILPLKTLQDIIKSFPDNTKITFKEEGNKIVSVEASGIKFKIKVCQQEGRNQIGDDKGEEYKINKDEFLENIRKVKIAMGDDEVRYYLNGINLEIYKDKEGNSHTFMVATNGHILATSGIKNNDYVLLQKVIMPKKVIPEIVKVLEKSNGIPTISFSKNKMDIKTENLEILLKLIEGDFPDYEKVIPYKNDKNVIIETQSIKDVLAKVCIVSNDKTKNVRISINSGLINLEITSSDGSMGNAEIKTNYNEDSIDIILNSKYLMDILEQIEEKNMILKLEDGVSPVLLEQEKNKNSLFVLMPVRS